uniref:Uncharacterized protein n=1 Tax=Lactuca sativa TaxID=4236 RepID=A0A9R1X2V9_LACSA|nr:hypothetical protein LSAT_V11C700374550 [Lactuca sativa]
MQYFCKQREELGMMASHTPQLQFLSWELIPLVDMFGYSCDTSLVFELKHSNIPRHGFPINSIINDDEVIQDDLDGRRNIVSMREYYCYKFQIQSNYNVILLEGRLLKQFIVDIYIKIETSCLEFCRKNEYEIRFFNETTYMPCMKLTDKKNSIPFSTQTIPSSSLFRYDH